MSKKKNRQFNQSYATRPALDHATEYKIIRHDLVRVLILNLLFLAALLTLYYTNLHSHYLETWFSKFLHF